jgi:hypothetical protein
MGRTWNLVPRSEIGKKDITDPEPGVKKGPNSGSAKLVIIYKKF